MGLLLPIMYLGNLQMMFFRDKSLGNGVFRDKGVGFGLRFEILGFWVQFKDVLFVCEQR